MTNQCKAEDYELQNEEPHMVVMNPADYSERLKTTTLEALFPALCTQFVWVLNHQ